MTSIKEEESDNNKDNKNCVSNESKPEEYPTQLHEKAKQATQDNKKVKKQSSLLNDWGNDEDDDEDDPEISFKDESLVIKSPSKEAVKVKEENKMEEAVSNSLSKSASLASTINVEKEIKSETAKDQQPIPKKRSIFKSKTSGDSKKGLSLYKHKWNNTNTTDDKEDFKKEVMNRAIFGFDSGEFDDNPTPVTEMSFASSKLKRVASAPVKDDFDDNEVVTSVKCPKEQKEYYTVIRNVKKAHQIQDSGEFQEFNDDVDYILGGLGAKNSLSTRCLSTVTLASKCMEPGFRMHLRAHGKKLQLKCHLRTKAIFFEF